MNKAELIEAISAHYQGSKAEAARALNAVVQTITHQTAGGEKVSITGFGVFEKVNRAARMVRNPRTGERKRAKATAVPRFRAGSDLKAYVSGTKKLPKATKKAAAPDAKTVAASTTPTKKAASTKASTTKKITATKATPTKKSTAAKKASTAKSAATKVAAAAKKAIKR